MPLACDPNETVAIYLDTDMDKPESERAVFLARHLTCAETRQAKQLTQQAYDEKDPEKEQALLDQVLALQFAGWKNVSDRKGQPVPFDVAEGRLMTADLALGSIDKWELVRAAVPATQLSHLEKKRSRSRLRSAAAPSAANAAATENATPLSPSATMESAPPASAAAAKGP